MKIGEIETDIKLPEKLYPKYPFYRMKVGESVFIMFNSTDGVGIYNSIKSTASRLKPTMIFTMRRIWGKGVRVWRIA